MTLSTTDINLIQSLNFISEQLNRYLSPIIFIFGTVGNILNCFVLSQRALRLNPCAVLFLASSFFGLISILFGVPTRILAGWYLDPTTTVSSICKLRGFVVFSTRTIAIWLTALASIDRWLLSCVDIHRRQISTLKNVQRSIIASVILSIVLHSHMLYCYEPNLTDAPMQCYGKYGACRTITDLMYALISVIIPLIVMIIFGLLTLSNVHQIHNRVQHMGSDIGNHHHNEHRDLHLRKIDHHLLRMLLVQIIFSMLFYIPQAFQNLYIIFTPYGSGSELEDVIKTFQYNIEILLAFIGSGMPFYIYTLAGGSIFRNAFISLMRTIVRKMTCQSSS